MAEVSSAMGVRNSLQNMQMDTYFNIGDMITSGDADLSGIPLLALSRVGLNLMLRFSPKMRKAVELCENSFSNETLVATKDGLIPIEEIKIGDEVWTYNEVNQTKSLQEVTHLIKGKNFKHLVDIKLNNGEVITATDNHPFWELDTRSWLKAEELNMNSLLLDIHEQNISVRGLRSYKEDTIVYNLSVANEHTFFVGTSGVLGHNCDIDKVMKKLVGQIPIEYCENQKCDKFASNLMKKLEANDIPYKKIEFDTIRGGPIGSDWYSPTQSHAPISLTGYHIGLKVGDKVYDNFNLSGVNYRSWITDMYVFPGDKMKRRKEKK